MSVNKLTFNYGAYSDTGTVRETNQDSGFAGRNFLLVADGMGGHAGGDAASAITTMMMSALDDAANPKGLSRLRLHNAEAKSLIERTIVQVYLAILEAVKEHPDLAGMGTTMTAILRTESEFMVAHLGDSRAYMLQNGELKHLTKDHTFVQHLVDTGKITENAAKAHPQKNVVMRVLGDFEVDLDPDIAYQPIIAGERYFICSDGVCGTLDDDDIAGVLKTTIDPNEAAKLLVERAIEAGSTDNCTAIVADVISERHMKQNQNVPIFVGAAKEQLQDYLNEIVEKSKATTNETLKAETKKDDIEPKKGLFKRFFGGNNEAPVD